MSHGKLGKMFDQEVRGLHRWILLLLCSSSFFLVFGWFGGLLVVPCFFVGFVFLESLCSPFWFYLDLCLAVCSILHF